MKTAAVCFALLLYIHHSVDADFCPNHKDKCPNWATCCLMNTGTYGCCPYKSAQCCPDKIHCCPSGTKCNVVVGSCDVALPEFSYRWMVPVYAQELVTKEASSKPTHNEKEEVGAHVGGVRCPDNESCPDGNTCCQMPFGNYGCCPYPSANCCHDKEHCCPNNYNCDIKHDRCIVKLSSWNELPFFKLEELPLFSLSKRAFETPTTPAVCSASVGCDLDAGYLCCTTDESSHCCPPSTVCGKEKNTCLTREDAPLETNPLVAERKRIGMSIVVCPDKREACPSSSTCCVLSSGNYGCCPMPEATCCTDMVHCCPNGYVCGDGDCERTPSFELLHLPVFVKRSRVFERRP